MKNKRITYTTDYTVEEGIIIPKEAYKSVMTNHTKRFHNCLYLLAGLNPCTRNLMDFLAEEMDNDNVVYSNAVTKDKFANFIAGVSEGTITYGESSIKKAYSTLCDKGLLRKLGRGIYKVNPEYFIKNTDDNRERLLRIELEFQEGLDTKLRIAKGQNVKEIQPYIDGNEEE
jgi:hypothetical protein